MLLPSDGIFIILRGGLGKPGGIGDGPYRVEST